MVIHIYMRNCGKEAFTFTVHSSLFALFTAVGKYSCITLVIKKIYV